MRDYPIWIVIVDSGQWLRYVPPIRFDSHAEIREYIEDETFAVIWTQEDEDIKTFLKLFSYSYQ